MSRSVSVTIVAVLSLLGSLLTLGLGLLMAIALLITGKSNPALKEPFAVIGMAIGMFFLIGPAIWGIATSVGLFLLKRWARISILVFSVLLVAMTVFSVPVMLLMPMPPTPGADARMFTYFRFGFAGFYLLLAAVGVWWLILFTRPSVKGQFSMSSAMGATTPNSVSVQSSGRPLSITIIGWLMIIGSAFAPLNWWLRPPIPFFWRMLEGWAALLYIGVYAAVAVYVGIGLLKLKPLCRTIAIWVHSFGVVNMAVFYLAPGRGERIQAMMNWTPSFIPRPRIGLPTTTSFFLVGALSGLAMVLVIVYFLVTSKPAFDRASKVPAELPA